ncbi:hypothetical protein Vretifemale_19520 [Volvox reticuliferus]|uniref:Uncharacterized protein n=1 Tax=Volvox reticuliferus TaxID=1737510 RepID=A0A8J4CZ73_9CHLO|nr:hypothetical protein Vretifemale_19520 [Volvox reticuliferus]
MTCATVEASENLASEGPISPQPSLDPLQPSPSRNIMQPAFIPPNASSTPPTAPAAPVTTTSAPVATEAAAADSSPAALLAASLVRSRATYFERLSSCNKASTSSAATNYGCSSTAVRHSMALTSQPLHPLAQHPLAGLPRSGGGAVAAASSSPREKNSPPQQQQKRQARRQRHRRRRVQLVPESDSSEEEQEADDDDSVDTFFDKPSYTCYGAAVELSPASSYGARAQRHTSSKPCAAEQPTESPPQPLEVVAAVEVHASTDAAPAGPCCSGYVRSMSAHFARVSSSSVRVGSVAGMDGLFDDLVTHVGALLASHPDVEAQMGMVQGLSDRLLQLHALCETLVRKVSWYGCQVGLG